MGSSPKPRLLEVAVCMVAALSLSACAKSRVVNGEMHKPYGFANADDRKDPAVEYDVSWGNVFWGIVGIETIILPIYTFGFALYAPQGPKPAYQAARQ